MTYLNDADFRYLGKPINTESSEVDCRWLIEEKLRSLLEALDTDTLTASAKNLAVPSFRRVKAPLVSPY